MDSMRVKFQKGFQKKFLLDFKKQTNLGWKDLANIININVGSLTKSYLFELCNLPQDVFLRILSINKKDQQEILVKYKASIIKQENNIGKKGIGNQTKNLSEIKIIYSNNQTDLNCSKIEYSRYDLIKNIKLPTKMTPELAEEIGMHFGDGFLSNSRYEYRLKGNPADEREYYLSHIKPLFKKLYNIEINPKGYTQSFGFEIKSKALWKFKTEVLGIKTGDKNTISIPKVLKVNNQEILCAFLRGLFDTDGCLYFRSGYGYKKYYPIIGLGLASKPLIKDVGEIMAMLGFEPNIYFYKDYASIRLNGIRSLKRYEKLIGWSSQKNLKRISDWKKSYPELDNSMAVVV